MFNLNDINTSRLLYYNPRVKNETKRWAYIYCIQQNQLGYNQIFYKDSFGSVFVLSSSRGKEIESVTSSISRAKPDVGRNSDSGEYDGQITLSLSRVI